MISITIVVAFAAASAIACCAARPSSATSRRRDADRRLRVVRRAPQRVQRADIALLMQAHELPADEIEMVLAKAQRRDIQAITMWAWAQRHGVHALAVVVAADLGPDKLLAHLAGGTLPDLAALEVFAALNGLSIARTPVPVLEPVAPPAAAA